MVIDRLQVDPSGVLTRSSARKASGTDSGFEALLASRLSGGEESAAPTPQDAATILRMEMMRSSLALVGDAEAVEAAACHPLGVFAGLPAGAHPDAQHDGPGYLGGELKPVEREAFADAAGAVGIEATAARYLGTPYRFGGEGGDGIDCSSFVQRVYLEHRVELPRTAREQIQVGREVAPGELRKGDLVFFQTYATYPSHVGIYLGDGKMIHASSEKGEVTVTDINSEYYRSRYLGAKRVT